MNVDRVDALNDQIKDRYVKYTRDIQAVRASKKISPEADAIVSEMIVFLNYISGELNDTLDKAINNNSPKGGRRYRSRRTNTRRRR
jgi:hypothetical protein